MKAITKEAREQQINSIPNIVFLGWVGEYSSNKSIVRVKCKIDGHEWNRSINGLLHSKTGCSVCAGNFKYSESERIEQINKIPGMSFIGFKSEYKNAFSKATMKCNQCDYEWESTVDNVLRGKKCPCCAGNLKKTKEQREHQLTSFDTISFIGWVEGYKNIFSMVKMHCKNCGRNWVTNANNIINHLNGCPDCAKYGFNESKDAYLYLLLSNCKTMCKIGIAGDHNQRHRQLRKATPFAFNCVGLKFGIGYDVAKAEKHILGSFDAVSFDSKFDGSTEWRHFTSDIMDLFNGIDYLKNIDCNQYEDKKDTKYEALK